jgi:hypothetical protein
MLLTLKYNFIITTLCNHIVSKYLKEDLRINVIFYVCSHIFYFQHFISSCGIQIAEQGILFQPALVLLQ